MNGIFKDFNCTAHNGVLIDNKVFVLYCHKCDHK